jgi:hypothetical protein
MFQNIPFSNTLYVYNIRISMTVKIHTLVWFEGVGVPESSTAPYSDTTIDSLSTFLGNTGTQLLDYTVS